MLVFRILATICVGISCLTAMFKNINMFGGKDGISEAFVIGTTAWGWLWRAFVIVAIWLI